MNRGLIYQTVIESKAQWVGGGGGGVSFLHKHNANIATNFNMSLHEVYLDTFHFELIIIILVSRNLRKRKYNHITCHPLYIPPNHFLFTV